MGKPNTEERLFNTDGWTRCDYSGRERNEHEAESNHYGRRVGSGFEREYGSGGVYGWVGAVSIEPAMLGVGSVGVVG